MENPSFEKFKVGLGDEKNGGRKRKRCLIAIVVSILLVVVVIAVALGITLSKPKKAIKIEQLKNKGFYPFGTWDSDRFAPTARARQVKNKGFYPFGTWDPARFAPNARARQVTKGFNPFGWDPAGPSPTARARQVKNKDFYPFGTPYPNTPPWEGRFGRISNFIIRITGYYRMELGGARGGNHIYNSSLTYSGGRGARVTTIVYLKAGTHLRIVEGQVGGDYRSPVLYPFESATGGGGGSFVYSNDILYAAAGGGGGAGNSLDYCTSKEGYPGRNVNDGGDAPSGGYYRTIQGGRNGHGGNGMNGPGGAGWFSNGIGKTSSAGKSRSNGWTGGKGYRGSSGDGGFGGGGGGECCRPADGPGAGGGGGYSGGAGSNRCGAGGGGSFCSPAARFCQMISGGNTRLDIGYVKIDRWI